MWRPRGHLANCWLEFRRETGYCKSMAELRPDLFVSTEAECEVDAETSAAIERGIKAADEGRVVSSEEVPALLTQWISKLSTPSRR